MLHGSKDCANWEVTDFTGLFRLRRTRCTKVPRIAPAVVEFLGSGARSVTLLNEQAQADRVASFLFHRSSPQKRGRALL